MLPPFAPLRPRRSAHWVTVLQAWIKYPEENISYYELSAVPPHAHRLFSAHAYDQAPIPVI